MDEYESELERLDRAVIQTTSGLAELLDRAVIQTASGLAELLVMAPWSEITSRTPGRTPRGWTG